MTHHKAEKHALYSHHLLPLLAFVFCFLSSQVWANESQLESTKPDRSDWADSELVYRNAFGVLGIVKSAQPTWNPRYFQSIQANPKWDWNKNFSLSAQIELVGEFTQADWTSDRFFFSDLELAVDARNFDAFEFFGTQIAASAGVRVPTSKVSMADGLLFAPELKLVLSRALWTTDQSHAEDLRTKKQYSLLERLHFAIELAAMRPIHRYTTGELSDHPIRNCQTSACQTLSQIPIRNVAWGLTQVFQAHWQLTEGIVLAAFFGLSQNRLYDLAKAEGISYRVDAPIHWRYEVSSGLTLSHRLMKGLAIRYGLASAHAPFKEDGRTRHIPLFNRHALFFLDLKANLPQFID